MNGLKLGDEEIKVEDKNGNDFNVPHSQDIGL